MNKEKEIEQQDYNNTLKLTYDDIKNRYPFNLACDVFEDEYAMYYTCLPELLDCVDSQLTFKETALVRMRYRDHFTFRECGEHFSISGSRSREIIRKALRKLRRNKHKIMFSNITTAEYMALKAENECLKKALENDKVDTDKIVILPKDIDCLELSVRSYNALRRANYNTLECFIGKKYSDLFELRNLGKKSLIEVVNALSNYGITIVNDMGREFD